MPTKPIFITKVLHAISLLVYSCLKKCSRTAYTVIAYYVALINLVSTMYFSSKATPITDNDYSCLTKL